MAWLRPMFSLGPEALPRGLVHAEVRRNAVPCGQRCAAVWQLPFTKNGALSFGVREVRCEDLLEVIAEGSSAGKEVRIFGLGGFTPATR